MKVMWPFLVQTGNNSTLARCMIFRNGIEEASIKFWWLVITERICVPEVFLSMSITVEVRN